MSRDGPLDEDALRPDSELFEPLGHRDLGVEGGELTDKAVMTPDPAEQVARDGEPGPSHEIDPKTEGELDETFDEAEDSMADVGDLDEFDVELDFDAVD